MEGLSRLEHIRSSRDKKIIVVSICFCMVSITIFVILGLSLFYIGVFDPPHPCTSTSCISSVINLMISMDRSVDPCSDFYSYACGQRHANISIDNNRMNEHQKQIDNRLIELINNHSIYVNMSIFHKALSYYKFCLHSDERIEAKYNRELLNELGGWPVEQTNWNKTGFLLNSVALATKISKHGLFEFGVTFNEKTGVKNIMTIKPVRTDEVTSNISNLISNFQNRFTHSDIRKIEKLDEARNFGIVTDPEDSVEIITIEEFSKITKFNHWEKFINMVMKDVCRNISKNDEIAVYNIKYFKNLFEVINKENIEEKTIANYIVFQAKHFFHELMIKYGFNEKTSTPQKCISLLKDLMPLYVDNLYIKEMVYKSHMIEHLTEFLKDTFEELSTETSWIDEITQISFTSKLQKMQFLFGYNPKVRDIDFVNGYYQHISDSNISVLQISRIINLNRFAKINVPANRTSWPDRSITNARIYNQIKNNVIVIPISVLQEPLFDPGLTSYINLASVGFLISREIINGFIGEGSKRDMLGRLSDWWTNQTKEQFEKKSKCFMEQYDALNIPERDMNKTIDRTNRTIIADYMGISLAYRAHQKWEKIYGKDRSLPRLKNFTTSQLFFLYFANLWCLSDRYRFITYLNITKDFSESFKCHSDFITKSDEKCNIW